MEVNAFGIDDKRMQRFCDRVNLMALLHRERQRMNTSLSRLEIVQLSTVLFARSYAPFASL